MEVTARPEVGDLKGREKVATCSLTMLLSAVVRGWLPACLQCALCGIAELYV